jgi:hypothetical protein
MHADDQLRFPWTQAADAVGMWGMWTWRRKPTTKRPPGGCTALSAMGQCTAPAQMQRSPPAAPAAGGPVQEHSGSEATWSVLE